MSPREGVSLIVRVLVVGTPTPGWLAILKTRATRVSVARRARPKRSLSLWKRQEVQALLCRR